jgi:hypothetical protein
MHIHIQEAGRWVIGLLLGSAEAWQSTRLVHQSGGSVK